MSYLCFLVIMIILSLVSVVFSLIAPIMVQIWSKSVEGITIYRILLLSIIMAVFMIINILFIVIKEHYSRKLNRENFFDYLKDILTLKYDYIISEGIMKILDKTIMSVNNIYLFITGDNIKLITNSLVMLIVSSWILYINKYIFLACLIVIPINILGFAKINKVLLEKSRNMELQVTTGWQKVLSVISNTEYIKQKSNPDIIKNYLSDTVDTIYNSMSDVNMYSVSTSTLISSNNSIFQTVILTYGVYNFAFVGHDYFSLMILMILIPTFFSTLSSLVGSKLNKRNFTIAKEFKENLEKMSEVYSGNNLEEIKNISFNISELKLPTHSINVNIVGEFSNGIFINGKEINSYNLLALRNRIEYMGQDAYVFQGSLEDNLFFGIDNYKDKIDSLKQDPLLKTIFSSKDLDSNIFNLGADLSGGEKQKIALARAINSDVDILLLDEITSSIDKESSVEIYNRIKEISKDKIIFIISHDDIVDNICNKEILI